MFQETHTHTERTGEEGRGVGGSGKEEGDTERHTPRETGRQTKLLSYLAGLTLSSKSIVLTNLST